jgi:hypothetical protein
LGLTGAADSHWAAGYNSSYAAASYAAASSFAYGSTGGATGTEGQQNIDPHSASSASGGPGNAAATSQIPTGKSSF